MRSRIFCLLPLLVLLQSCGKSDDNAAAATSDAGSVPPGATVTNVGSSYSMTQPIQGGPNYYFVNYQFKEGTCDTDLHRFSGPSPDIVRAQLCGGLQNGWMNHNCAPDLRQAYYAQMCN
jgi:hypothetical protein